jgi:hypothetical protein
MPSVLAPAAAGAAVSTSKAVGSNVKDALLTEIRKSKSVFYNTVVAQAQRIDVTPDRVTFTFSAVQRGLRDMFERERGWLESLAQQVTGRKVAFASMQADAVQSAGSVAAAGDDEPAKAEKKAADRKSALKEQALADAGVQALLEVFPGEIRDVEEM